MALGWRDYELGFPRLNELQRRVNRLFEEIEPTRGYVYGGWPFARTWPPVNIYDAGDEVIVRAQVPGLSEKDINISGGQDSLTITGERRAEPPKGYSVARQERGTVSFNRTFSLPCAVDLEKASALVKDGVLTVKLGKAESARPRQISVRSE